MKKYKAVFFDLDHTLWDFELNSEYALIELFNVHNLADIGINDPSEFILHYREINKKMWDAYHTKSITKELLRSGRFNQTLEKFGIKNEKLAESLAADYLRICPVKTNLFPGALDILNYLSQKYSLHIITNGFKEVQYLKIRNSGLLSFFRNIHISEEIGFRKPEAEIFNYAVKKSGTVHEQCIMIGDNLEADICGAENAGIDAVFFNPMKTQPEKKVMYEIDHLEQLKTIL